MISIVFFNITFKLLSKQAKIKVLGNSLRVICMLSENEKIN